MIIHKTGILILLLAMTIGAYAQTLGEFTVHDPVLIKQKDTYYLFSTGHGIAVSTSKDLKNWQRATPVFSKPPDWAIKAVPTFKGHIWAPDISYYQGKYHLYYSVSAFGKNTSCIGVATNVTLDAAAPDFKWVDHGLLIQSFPGKTNWNAIDPNFILDEKGNPYLSFGSFWDGLKLIKLKKDGLSIDEDPAKIPTIASRKLDNKVDNPPAIDDNPKDAGGNAIEAPFIYKHDNGYYYLFASIDYCCKGVKSTYKMIVGRSKKLIGPYLDDNGLDMAKSGGKLVLAGNELWHGVGHNAVVKVEDQDYLIFHGYDAKDEGKPKLLIEKIVWDKNDWPVVNLKTASISNP